MLDIIIKTVITFCMVYTLKDCLVALFNCFFHHNGDSHGDVFVIVRVCNLEDSLEGIIRNIIWNELNVLNGGFIPNIVIVDMGSDDCTRLIGERLSDDYSFIYYTTAEDYDEFVNKNIL